MTTYYIVRTVKPGTPCSHPVGTTLICDGWRNEAACQVAVEKFNRNIGGGLEGMIRYSAVALDDSVDNTGMFDHCQ